MRFVNPRAVLLLRLEQARGLRHDELEQVHADREVRRRDDAEPGALGLRPQLGLVRRPAGRADHRRQLALDVAREIRAQRIRRRKIDRDVGRSVPVAAPTSIFSVTSQSCDGASSRDSLMKG